MKHFTFESHWNAIKGQLKKRYKQFANEDLNLITGRGEELFDGLRQKLNMTARDLKSLLEELEAGAGGRMEQVKAKAADIADDVREKFGDAIDEAKTKGAAVAGEVKAHAGVAYKEARKGLVSLRKEGEEYVRQNPREVLVAAVCAGFVASLLIRR
jgi:ElaB/YqjD/DUF883 family membrane-anchored ribosome-binding protein